MTFIEVSIQGSSSLSGLCRTVPRNHTSISILCTLVDFSSYLSPALLRKSDFY